MLEPPCRVILASGSPRRKELLARLVNRFEVIPADIDESPEPGLSPSDLAEKLAWRKASQVADAANDALVIGADTVVAIWDEGWTSLGKPVDQEDAGRMLGLLSGKTHHVFTGVALIWRVRHDRFVAETTVTFRDLRDDEVAAYVAGGEPMDKAGAYAIQGGAAPFVQDLEGSLSNVIGLPMQELERRVKRFLG